MGEGPVAWSSSPGGTVREPHGHRESTWPCLWVVPDAVPSSAQSHGHRVWGQVGSRALWPSPTRPQPGLTHLLAKEGAG